MNKCSFVVHVNITTIVQLVFVVYFTLKYTATTAILVGYGYGYGGIILPKFKFPTFFFGQMTTSCRAKKSSQLSTTVLVVLVPTRIRRIFLLRIQFFWFLALAIKWSLEGPMMGQWWWPILLLGSISLIYTIEMKVLYLCSSISSLRYVLVLPVESREYHTYHRYRYSFFLTLKSLSPYSLWNPSKQQATTKTKTCDSFESKRIIHIHIILYRIIL